MLTDKRKARDWSDLPNDLLSLIPERAGPFEFLNFCLTCKSWNSASSTALRRILDSEANQGPWFLLYEDKNSECQFLSGSGKKFTRSLSELDTSICLATVQGWLLLFQQGCGSMFFFHLFSRERIDLPQFPDSELTDHVAAISCPPTSQQCVVCVISRSSDAELEARVLHLGEEQAWIGSKYSHPRADTDTIKCGLYHNVQGMFFFCDIACRTTIAISTENREIKWDCFPLNSINSSEIDGGNVQPSKTNRFLGSCTPDELKYSWKDMKNKLGLVEDISVSTILLVGQLHLHIGIFSTRGSAIMKTNQRTVLSKGYGSNQGSFKSPQKIMKLRIKSFEYIIYIPVVYWFQLIYLGY